MNETRNRLDFYNQDREANPLRQSVVDGLQAMLDENNILVQTFCTARDRLNEGAIQQAHIRLLARRAGVGREYELPTSDEIAALIVEEAGEEMFGHDIIVQHRTLEMEQISMYHPSLMPLQYPILFPYGEDGWHPELFYYDGQFMEGDDDNGIGQRNMSQCDYYSYVLQTRLEQSNSFMLAGKLLQQYMVNAYALVEAERLAWIRNNQATLRAHYFQGLLDSFMRGDTDLELSGKHVILAASHTGSPRYKYENFQDAMAICRSLGYPDLFITFTCNANWPEIQLMSDLLALRGIKDPNRADAIARVYKMKLNQLMYEIKDRHIFGKTCARRFYLFLHAIHH
ncbi:unnamed protein product [Linum trigynum]|uniref:Helitron helicase-like domain-containing protein n=1 Tax=Linum trigynum TaxID=586398 RepID=A0AAV2D9C3_9ROSI